MRIARAIRSSGKSYAEVARAVGVKQQAVYGWIKTGRVGKDTLSAVATATATTLEWLVSGDDSALERRADWRIASVPLLEWDEILSDRETKQTINVVTEKGIGMQAFAVKVRGRAMDSEFPDGTVIVVDPERQPSPGCFVVASVSGACVLRQLIEDGGTQALAAIDRTFPIIPIDDHCAIIGTVVLSQKHF